MDHVSPSFRMAACCRERPALSGNARSHEAARPIVNRAPSRDTRREAPSGGMTINSRTIASIMPKYPLMWGRLAACAAVVYRRRWCNRGVGRLTIGQVANLVANPMSLSFRLADCLHKLWGGQFCPQPPSRRLFRSAGRFSLGREPAKSRLQPELAAPQSVRRAALMKSK